MTFDKEKFKKILEERGIEEFLSDPKKMLDECGLKITDEQASYIKEQLEQKAAPTEKDVLNVICIQDNE
ncbi:MAG: hypothetical protein ACFFD4_39275 [Candidatus Odinarchaeota archaeon]